MDQIFVAAVQTPAEDIFQIRGGCFISGTAVVNALGVFILAGEQCIGNGAGTIGDGGLAQAQVEARFMPEAVADCTGGTQKCINLRIFPVGGQVKILPIQNEVSIQIHIVLVVAAQILHAVGIHIGHHQYAGIGIIQGGVDFPEKNLQHCGADIAFNAMNPCGEDNQVGLGVGCRKIETVDIQAVGFIQSIAVDLGSHICSQPLQMIPDFPVGSMKGSAVGIAFCTFRLPHGIENHMGAGQGGQYCQQEENAKNPKQCLFHMQHSQYAIIQLL